MSIGILLYLDLEFWEGTLKTLTPSLQENAKYFTTRSYLTLTLIPDAAPEFTEVSLHGRQDPCAAPAAVLRAGTVTVDLFEDTPRELLETILKAVRSC